MRGITNTVAIAGLAGTLIMGALGPAAAQTWNGNGWSTGPMVSAQVGLNTGYAGYGYGSDYSVNRGPMIEAPVAARMGGGFYGYGTSALGGSCVFDEGYGRVLPCQYSGGAR